MLMRKLVQVRITIDARMRLKELAERAPGGRSVSNLIDLLSYAQPHHLADIMAAATSPQGTAQAPASTTSAPR